MSHDELLENIQNGKYYAKTPYATDRKQYMIETAAGEQDFRQDLYKAFEVEGNPKADKVYALAWSHGHSNGFTEVLNYFSEFVELIK